MNSGQLLSSFFLVAKRKKIDLVFLDGLNYIYSKLMAVQKGMNPFTIVCD